MIVLVFVSAFTLLPHRGLAHRSAARARRWGSQAHNGAGGREEIAARGGAERARYRRLVGSATWTARTLRADHDVVMQQKSPTRTRFEIDAMGAQKTVRVFDGRAPSPPLPPFYLPFVAVVFSLYSLSLVPSLRTIQCFGLWPPPFCLDYYLPCHSDLPVHQSIFSSSSLACRIFFGC